MLTAPPLETEGTLIGMTIQVNNPNNPDIPIVSHNVHTRHSTHDNPDNTLQNIRIFTLMITDNP